MPQRLTLPPLLLQHLGISDSPQGTGVTEGLASTAGMRWGDSDVTTSPQVVRPHSGHQDSERA